MPTQATPVSTYKEHAAITANVLSSGFPENSLDTDWWGSAVALESLIDYMTLTQSDEYSALIDKTYNQGIIKRDHFINDYYDDTCWWAISWMTAHNFVKKDKPDVAAKYLAVAKRIHVYLLTGWDDVVCGGGLFWRKNPNTYKAAIQNELFLVLSARLYQHTKKDHYKDSALKVWNWFNGTAMINSDNLVQNGLDDQHGCQCHRPEDKKIWTYNQGVILGGLVDLYDITKETALLLKAREIANAAIRKLCYDNRVLRENCEIDEEHPCNRDAKHFKGIFMRYLSYFRAHLSADDPDRARYETFIKWNADSVWKHAMGPSDQFGSKWIGPYDERTLGTQMSALDAFNAAISLD